MFQVLRQGPAATREAKRESAEDMSQRVHGGCDGIQKSALGMMTPCHQLVLDMLDYQKFSAKTCFIALTIIVYIFSALYSP